MKDLNLALEILPAQIAEMTEKENTAYANMIIAHERYKQERAKMYLILKAKGGATIRDIDYTLDCDNTICAIKDTELQAEILYRSYRMKKEQYYSEFQAAMEQARNIRKELSTLNNTVFEDKK